MACVANRVKAGSLGGVLLLTILATSLPSRGDDDLQWQKVKDDLTKASSGSLDKPEQDELLQSDLNILKDQPGGSKIYHGHKAEAMTHIEAALTDLKNDELPDKIQQDISLALKEVLTSISLLADYSARTASQNSDTANPLGAGDQPAAPDKSAQVVALTTDQERAVVLITGDKGEGTGFMIRTPDGPMVVTNIHVIANNPNLKITTNTGALVTTLSAKAASDRDLVLLAIQDANYSYLDVSTDISRTVQPGDEVITPGNSEGGEVMLNTAGKILGIGPERIEFDNPIYHGNSGGPVFHLKSGKVLGVVTEAMKVVNADDLDKTSFASRNSAIGGMMRYFGLRLDTVTAWVPIDWQRFQNESAFLDDFHLDSRCLDSYINGSNDNGDDQDGGDTANLYRSNAKIMKANDNYLEQATGSDTSQRIQSLQGLIFDLKDLADDRVDQIENPNNFYSFDEKRAQEELAYRKALKKELDSVGDDISRLRQLPRADN
jgi:hypothetical protein